MNDMEKKWRTGYKVCRRQGNRYISTHAGRSYCDKGRGYKVYGIGHVTKRTRGNGPLAVFSNTKDALQFSVKYCGTFVGVVIFECKYLQSDDGRYWLKIKGKRSYNQSNIAGKRFADEVELIEEIEVNA